MQDIFKPNCVVIDAPDGLIVYDTGDWSGEGRHFREVIEQQISKRPIKAIIYSHSHYALGGGAMVEATAMASRCCCVAMSTG